MFAFRALSLRRITTALFVYSGVVSRHKPLKIDFPLTLMVYDRKVITSIKKQNAMANWASIKDYRDLAEKGIRKYCFRLCIAEAKPSKI